MTPIKMELPPLEEQVEIARRIERTWSWLEKVEHESGKANSLLARLDQGLLNKAFRGELVQQNPADEPAAALLAIPWDANRVVGGSGHMM